MCSLDTCPGQLCSWSGVMQRAKQRAWTVHAPCVHATCSIVQHLLILATSRTLPDKSPAWQCGCKHPNLNTITAGSLFAANYQFSPGSSHALTQGLATANACNLPSVCLLKPPGMPIHACCQAACEQQSPPVLTRPTSNRASSIQLLPLASTVKAAGAGLEPCAAFQYRSFPPRCPRRT
jgi:hypothetical protein